MSEPLLRLARPADVPAIEQLLAADGLPPYQVTEFLDTFWTVEKEGRLVGCAGLEVYGQSGVIRSVVIAPETRGSGQGERLVETALAEARRQGVRRLYLFTMTAAPFFARWGFEPCTLDDFETAAQGSWQYRVMRMRPDVAAHITPMRMQLDNG